MSGTVTLIPDTSSAAPSTLSSTLDVTPTVIVFGTTGAGKSSVINMLPDNPAHPAESAVVKASASGVTTQIKHFHKVVGGQRFTIVDTMGTGEMKTGTVPTHLAIERLYDHLVASSTPAIHLVLIVMRASRITSLSECNYLLARYLFGNEVPIALVLTHMDNIENRDTWWDEQENRGRLGLLKAVGVVSFIGRRKVLEPFYDESREDISRFISTQLRPGAGYKLQGKLHVHRLTAALANLIAKHNEAARFHAAMLDLLKGYEIDDRHAKPLAKKMKVVAPLPVVIFVGARGSGKTTLINMLPTDNHAAADTSTAEDVQEYIRIVKGERIRVLETLGIPPPFPPDSESIYRAVRALYDSVMAHPLGIRLVVLVAKLEGEDLAPIDITHYDAIRRFCGEHIPICLITIHPKNSSSPGSLINRHKELAFQKHVSLETISPGATQRHLDTSKPIVEGAVASLVKSKTDAPVQPELDVAKLLKSLPGYDTIIPLSDRGDMEGLEQNNLLPSAQERRRVLLFGPPGAGTTSVVKMFKEAPRANEFELINDDDVLPKRFHSGLSLLVVVLAASRITGTKSDGIAYRQLKARSEGRIPVCVVATHMDTIDDPAAWWEETKQSFIRANVMMDFATPPTCVTTIRGPIIKQETGERAYDPQYKASVLELQRLFLDRALSIPYSRPKPNPTGLAKLKAKLVVRLGGKAPGFSEYCYYSFRTFGCSANEAKEAANNWALREYLMD